MSGNSKTETLEADIAIIGSGAGGLAAALAAVENGYQAIVLEKQAVAGGNSNRASGIFAAESIVQSRQKVLASRDELFKFAMDFAHYRIDPRILRTFIDKSADTICWLEARGVKFRLPISYHNASPLTFHCPEGRGRGMIRALVKSCDEMGVRIIYRTTAKKLLTNENGNVTGVLGMTGKKGDEKEIRIAAKSVIIASGGYGGNKELLKKFSPYYRESMINRGISNMGEGLLMAMEVGAATDGLGILQTTGPIFPGAAKFVADAVDPRTIWVNSKGERFIDEMVGFNWFESVNAVMRQPGSICYSLFDEKIKQVFVEVGPDSHGVPWWLEEEARIDPDFDRKFQVEVDRGWAMKADSWEDIAGWMGVDPKALFTTIDEYNACCDRGYDNIFAKKRYFLKSLSTPPFYALKCCSAYLCTMGGLKINHRMEVVNQDGGAISGLYAAGVDTGGWEGETYCLKLTGSTLGFAVNSGRIAGENAAMFVSQKLLRE